MSVDDIIGLTLLRVTGGKPTSDSSVQPADIKSYIPDAINAVMGGRIGEEYGVDPSIYPNGLFINVLEDIPVSVNSRNLAYITFPQRPLSVRGGKSVVAVGEQGGRTFTRIFHDEGTLGSFYWKTKTDVTTYDVEGMTAVFYNLPVSVETVFAKLVVHIDSLDYGDDIFVPSGTETLLIETIYQMVMQQRMNPKDRVIDGEDKV